jgi:tripartite-type tricarboxylate transporter receptor subunit TctC
MAGVLGAVLGQPARADDWPSRQIFWICPFAAGGGADTISRLVGAEIGNLFGRQVLIENKPGASGLIGTRQIAAAAPDGYTVGLLSDIHCVNLAQGQQLGYDAEKDFTYISQLIRVPMGLYTSGKRPYLRTLPDLIRFAKANPGKLTAASIGPATTHHLAMEWLKAIEGIDVIIVNFGGIPQGVQALLSGDADMMFMGVSVSADAYIAQGLVYQVGVATRERLASAPNQPTFIEQGIADFELISWYGLIAPAGLPEPVLRRLHSSLTSSLESPRIRRRIEETGVQVASTSPTDFAAMVRASTAKYKKIVALTNADAKGR